MAFCRECRTQISDNAKFCSECGASNSTIVHPEKRQHEYSGRIIKCPNCGDALKSFTANCPSCGHEIRATEATNSVRELAQKLEVLVAARKQQKPKLLFQQARTYEQEANLIRNFLIPNTKEDIIEFMILASTNVDIDTYKLDKKAIGNSSRVVSEAWKSKFEQAYQKAEILFREDPEFQHIKIVNKQMTANIRKAKSRIWITWIILALIVVLSWTALLGGLNKVGKESNAKEIARLEAIVIEVEDYLELGEYKLALVIAESIETDSYNRDTKRQYDNKREFYIVKVIEKAAQNGIILERTPPLNNTVSSSNAINSNETKGE